MAWMDVPDFRWLTDSNPSPGVAQAFALGFQGRQREMDRELQMRELDLRSEQQKILNELRTEKLEAERVRNDGMVAMAGVVGRIAREKKWNDPAARAEFWDTAAKFPQLMADPSFKELTQQFELADQAEQRRLLAEGVTERQFGLETMRQEGRQRLQADKYSRLAEMAEESEEAKALRDEIRHDHRMELEEYEQENRLDRDRAQHGYRLEEQARRPQTSRGGVGRFDLPWTAQETMKAELAAINRDITLLSKPEEKLRRIEAVYRKYQTMAKDLQQQANPQQAQPQSAPKILKFNPATGKFE